VAIGSVNANGSAVHFPKLQLPWQTPQPNAELLFTAFPQKTIYNIYFQ